MLVDNPGLRLFAQKMTQNGSIYGNLIVKNVLFDRETIKKDTNCTSITALLEYRDASSHRITEFTKILWYHHGLTDIYPILRIFLFQP